MAGIPYYFIENTRFIFATNFEGNPEKDRFHSPGRKANIRLTEEQANELSAMGVNVKMTKPNPDRKYDEPYVPIYYTAVKLKYKNEGAKRDPRVYLVSDKNPPVELNAESVGILDDIWIENVKVKLNPWKHEKGVSLYIDVMYVVQKTDDDPWAQEFRHTPDPAEKGDITDPDELPF